MLPGQSRTDAALAAGVDLPPFSVRFDIVVVPLNGASRFGLGRGLGYVSETDAVFWVAGGRYSPVCKYAFGCSHSAIDLRS